MPPARAGKKKGLAGRAVLVTAGPTREHLDPVRFLTNASSGRMGYAIAAEAASRGAAVTLVSGPVAIDPPAGVRYVGVVTVEQMREAVLESAGSSDVVVMAAAVGDLGFPAEAKKKLKKTGLSLNVTLVPTPDILAELGRARRPRAKPRIVVGFALETDRVLENAREKLKRKTLDLVVANGLDSVGGQLSRATLIGADGSEVVLPPQSKPKSAAAILDAVERML